MHQTSLVFIVLSDIISFQISTSLFLLNVKISTQPTLYNFYIIPEVHPGCQLFSSSPKAATFVNQGFIATKCDWPLRLISDRNKAVRLVVSMANFCFYVLISGVSDRACSISTSSFRADVMSFSNAPESCHFLFCFFEKYLYLPVSQNS